MVKFRLDRKVRSVSPLVLLLPLFCVGCHRDYGIRESKSEYSIFAPGVEKVPIILVGEVTGKSAPVAPPHRSQNADFYVQLWRAKVKVENVLQGEIDPGTVDIFYFWFWRPITGGQEPLNLPLGERDIFFLMKDGGHLRTICDAARNCSVMTILTGAHPNFRRAPGQSISQAITDILLTRGIGVNDKQMVEAVDRQGSLQQFGEQPMVRTLQSLVHKESPPVREAACESLREWKRHCDETDNSTPSLVIQNLTHPNALSKFQLGDRFRTTVTGPPNQSVYRSIVEANQADTKQVGTTDANGHFMIEEIRHSLPRTRTELWSVSDTQASPAVSYVFAKSIGQGQVLATPVGKARDRHGMAISVLSISGKTVTTYAAIQLGYHTSLYYDVMAVSTLYQESKAIKTQKLIGRILASDISEAPTISWNDYFVRTDQYAVAFFGSGDFNNPSRFADGSCFGMSGDCQIVPLGGPDRVPKATIFLGSTGADQTAVRLDADFLLGGMGSDDKSSLLGSLLTRGEETDDSYMIAMIRTAAASQRQFGPDSIAKKMQQLAVVETPAVRKAACGVLKNLNRPCPKSQVRPTAGNRPPLHPASKRPVAPPPIDPDPLRVTAIPKYLVYTHFLTMIQLLDEQKFASPLYLLDVPRADFPSLRSEASELTKDLATLDRKAKTVIDAFRVRAKAALQRGEPMPAAPPEIYRLQALRTAVSVHHMANLQAMLGSQKTTNLETFLANQIARHTRLGQLAPPASIPQ